MGNVFCVRQALRTTGGIKYVVKSPNIYQELKKNAQIKIYINKCYKVHLTHVHFLVIVSLFEIIHIQILFLPFWRPKLFLKNGETF